MNGMNVLFSSASEEWGTPQDLFDELNYVYNFTLDPSASDYNHKCEKYFTKDDDGLSKSWSGETVFCNPPYGRHIGDWVKKAYDESLKGTKIVMLIPARTDTRWFHDYIYRKDNVRVEFIRGRLKFVDCLNREKKANSATFPSMLVFFNL